MFIQCNLDLVLLNFLLSAFNSSVAPSTHPTVSFLVSSLGMYVRSTYQLVVPGTTTTTKVVVVVCTTRYRTTTVATTLLVLIKSEVP